MLRSTYLVLVLVLILALAGCAPAAAPTAAPTGPGSAPSASAALNITGAVAKPQALALAALKAMPPAQVKAESPKQGMQEYSGVRLNALLDQAQPQASAAKLTLVASDGFSSEISLADVRKCADCLISFNADKLDAVMPGQATNTWVRGLVKIEVK